MLNLMPARNDADIAFRYRMAQAIVSVTDDPHEQRLLASIAKWESSYEPRLASPSCTCKRGECDGGRALGSWQIIARTSAERRRLCVSLEEDARVALERVRESVRYCRRLPETERLAIYARGSCLSAKGRRLSRLRWVP
jgi:hypothetical protein